MEVIAYEPIWLERLAGLARAHARLTPPGSVLADDEVAAGLVEHRFWPFYSMGLGQAQTLLAVEGETLLAAAQVGFVAHGWGYGAVPGDGPDWLYDVHASLFWLFAWPAWPDALDAAARLAAHVVGWARQEGLDGLEAFRGGPGFFTFGTQLSRYWPHLHGPLRAAGFRQPRHLLVYSGPTDPAALPAVEAPRGLAIRARSRRLEAWWEGMPVGAVAAEVIGPGHGGDRASLRAADEAGAPDSVGGPDRPMRATDAARWAAIRRFAVDPAVRGRGIGTALFAAQLRRLAASGCKRFILHVPDAQEELPARAVYHKFGSVVDSHQVLRISF